MSIPIIIIMYLKRVTKRWRFFCGARKFLSRPPTIVTDAHRGAAAADPHL